MKKMKNLFLITTGTIVMKFLLTGCETKTNCSATQKYDEVTKTCIEIAPPVTKKDTTITFDAENAFNGDSKLPSSSVLDSIANLSHIANVYLKMNENQAGASAKNIGDVKDSLKKLNNPYIKIVGGKVRVWFDVSVYPTLIADYAELGLELVYDETLTQAMKRQQVLFAAKSSVDTKCNGKINRNFLKGKQNFANVLGNKSKEQV